MARSVTNDLNSWDFNKNHVQQNLTGGDFVGSHSVIICATAPRMEDLVSENLSNLTDGVGTDDGGANRGLGSTIAIPIGVVDSAAIQQDRQLAQIFELGSKRSYLMSARTMTQMSINRVIYKGANLLRMFYAYYPDQGASSVISEDYGNILRENQKKADTAYSGDPITLDSQFKATLPPSIRDNPGFNNFWLNLNSDIFSQPYGLILFMKDNNMSDVAAVFLEECYIQNHGMQASANSVVMAETCSIRCERIVPIKVKVDQMSDNSAGARQTGAVTSMYTPELQNLSF